MSNTDKQKRFEPHLQADEKLLWINNVPDYGTTAWGVAIAAIAIAIGFGVYIRGYIKEMNAPGGGALIFVVVPMFVAFAVVMVILLVVFFSMLVKKKSTLYCAVSNQRVLYLKHNKLMAAVPLADIDYSEHGKNSLVIVLKENAHEKYQTLTLPNVNDVVGLEVLLEGLIRKNNG